MIFKPGVFGLLLLEVTAGGCYLLTFMSRFERVNRTFYRLHGGLFLVFAGLAFFFMGPSAFTELSSLGFSSAGQSAITFLGIGTLALLVYNAMVFFGPWERQKVLSRPVLLSASLILFLSLGSGTLALIPNWNLTFHGVLLLSVTLSAAFLLGSVLLAMNLGHFYLTNPTLPIEPLLFLTRILVAIMVAVTILILPEALFNAHASTDFVKALKLESFQGLYVWGRLILGILGGLVISFMALKTVRMHSTQSATGLLYIELIFILFGQAFANFLYLRMGILL